MKIEIGPLMLTEGKGEDDEEEESEKELEPQPKKGKVIIIKKNQTGETGTCVNQALTHIRGKIKKIGCRCWIHKL